MNKNSSSNKRLHQIAAKTRLLVKRDVMHKLLSNIFKWAGYLVVFIVAIWVILFIAVDYWTDDCKKKPNIFDATGIDEFYRINGRRYIEDKRFNDINKYKNTTKLRRVKPCTFVGSYGQDFIVYAVPIEDVEKEYEEWKKLPVSNEQEKYIKDYTKENGKFVEIPMSKQRKEQKLMKRYSDIYSTDFAPDWWPDVRALELVSIIKTSEYSSHDLGVWLDRKAGKFYVSFGWGG